jgi:capsular polysaccharide export protein
VRAHDLIARAEAMVVINSSVGIESLYYQKPVVVLGRVFYRGFGLTIDLDDLTGIAAAVLRALEWKPDREGILRFFTATTAATAPGRFQDTSPENLALLSSVLERKGVRLADRRRAQVSAT